MARNSVRISTGARAPASVAGKHESKSEGGTAQIGRLGSTKKEIRRPHNLAEFIGQVLPAIDASLAREEPAPSARVLHAAMFFARHYVVQPELDSNSSYLSTPWFAAVHYAVHNWYVRRYGQANMRRQKRTALCALIRIFDAAFQVHVPLTVAQPQRDGTSWLIFPNRSLRQENPLEWILNPPNLTDLDKEETARLKRKLRKLAGDLRTSYLRFSTASFAAEKHRAMATMVWSHLNAAAEHALSSDRARRSLAIWEIQLALEKAMKSRIAQLDQAFAKTHDLTELTKRKAATFSQFSVQRILRTFPCKKQVMRLRYGEVPAPAVDQIVSWHTDALAAIASIAKTMESRICMDNARFLLRDPLYRRTTI